MLRCPGNVISGEQAYERPETHACGEVRIFQEVVFSLVINSAMLLID